MKSASRRVNDTVRTPHVFAVSPHDNSDSLTLTVSPYTRLTNTEKGRLRTVSSYPYITVYADSVLFPVPLRICISTPHVMRFTYGPVRFPHIYTERGGLCTVSSCPCLECVCGVLMCFAPLRMCIRMPHLSACLEIYIWTYTASVP